VPVQPVERKLAAIFAADIAGYSRLMARDEIATLARLKACRAIVDGLIATHRPIIMVEWVKSSKPQLSGVLQAEGYRVFEMRMNLLAVHQGDPSLAQIRQQPAATP